ncbi:MAG: baseplate J/gp47 family protein [Sulfuriferula sp.]
MPFLTLDYQAIRDGILRDISNQEPTASTGADSDYAIRANASGSAIEGVYQHQQWIARQIFPDTADSDNLERFGARYKIYRLQAVAATGSIDFSGTPGAADPVGTESKAIDGVAFVTTAAGVIGAGGTVNIAAQAAVAGAAGNKAAGTALMLTAAPPGVLSQAAINTMTGGADAEANAALLARILFRLQNPPCGGAAHDYYAWAIEVSGVSAAYVYSNRRGLGTTDVIILATGGLPSAGLVTSVQSHIDGVRPVQADFLVFGPTAVAVNITAALTLAAGYLLADVAAAINTALDAYFATLKPGGTCYINRIRAIISDTPGVVDFNLTAPAGNVATLVDATHTEIAVKGVVALT